MKASRTLRIAALAAAATLSAGTAAAEVFRNGQSVYGEPAKTVASARVVDASATRYLRVPYGETVVFKSQAGKEFAWTFNGVDRNAVDVAKIAPPEFKNSVTRVFVGGNPMTRN